MRPRVEPGLLVRLLAAAELSVPRVVLPDHLRDLGGTVGLGRATTSRTQ